jgi:hypothetical protein
MEIFQYLKRLFRLKNLKKIVARNENGNVLHYITNKNIQHIAQYLQNTLFNDLLTKQANFNMTSMDHMYGR